MSLLIGVAAILAMFVVLAVPHEFGHFGLAKAFRIKVHEYSLGIGGRVAGFTRGGTLYAVRAIPIAAYVRLAGMEPGEYDDPDGFHQRPAWKRIVVLLAGPAANLLVAGALMTAVLVSQVNLDPGLIQQVGVGSPAQSAGLRPNDSIRAVNGQRLTGPGDLVRIENGQPGRPLQLTVRRHSGTSFTTEVTPAYNAQAKRWMIGIQAAGVLTATDALVGGVTFPVRAVGIIFGGLGQVVTGQIPGGLFGPDGATGAIGMGALTVEAANQGLVTYASLVALLSVALAVTNLLPIPALDGGRILVVLIEAARRRPFDRDRELQVQRAGLIAIVALMAVIAFFDVQRLATGQFPTFR